MTMVEHRLPALDPEMKRQCLEAERIMLNSGVVVDHPKSGHCWCLTGRYIDVPHVACCKCGDRYVPREG